jgi:AcrR family transcriptional regulator
MPFQMWNTGTLMTQQYADAPLLFEARAIKSVSGTTRDASDGRVANRLRNREHVIDTFIELVNRGEKSTLDQVIGQSGVARRSIYRYFDDLSDLSMQVFRRMSEEAASDAVLDNPGVGPLPERISIFVSVRLHSLAKTHAFGLLARRRVANIDSVQDGLAAITNIARLQLVDQFEPELAEMNDERRERVIDTMILLTSFESYDVLKRQLGRQIDVVEVMWTEAITTILKAS